MLKIFYIIVLMMSSQINAANYVHGQGSYKAQSYHTNNYIKDYLLYLSFRNIVTKEMNRLGLNSKQFWKNYDQAFHKSFAGHQQRYELALNKSKEVQQKKILLMQRDQFKLSERKKFGGISHTIISYAIKSLGGRENKPSEKVMRVTSKVNYKALRKLYSRFMIDTLKTKGFKELVVIGKFDWGNIYFDKIGLKKKNDIEEKIISGWKDWFVQNQIPEKKKVIYTENEAPLTGSGSRALLYINIRAREENNQKPFMVRYQSSLALRDHDTGEFIYFKDIPSVKKQYQARSDESHLLANDTWALAIPYLVTIRSFLDKTIETENSSKLSIRNYKNISEILKIQDKLKTLGIGVNLLSTIDYFEQGNAQLNLRYNGVKDRLEGIVKNLKNDFFSVDISLEKTSSASETTEEMVFDKGLDQKSQAL